MTQFSRALIAGLSLVALTGCGKPPMAVAPTTAAVGTLAARAEAPKGGMPREQAAALAKALDKNGDGQVSHDETHLYIQWGPSNETMAENYPALFDPKPTSKPISTAMITEKMSAPGAMMMFSGAVGVKDTHLVPMGKADITRLSDAVAKALAVGPVVQRGRIPVRHVVSRHYNFRPGKDVIRWESLRWVSNTIAGQLANENNKVKIESSGTHPDSAYQFNYVEYKAI